jgi:enoyl-CoA hydratase/carnithine racemase
MSIRFECEGAVAILTIDRPKVHNALDFETSDALVDAWTRFRDDDDLRVAILTGAGERAFCAGADLRGVADFYEKLTSAQRLRRSEQVPGLGGITKNLAIDKPIVAAVNGHCLAGGLEIALACDLRIASQNATFGLPEVTRGIIPGAGGTQRLPRLIGPERALDLILTGRRIDAREAERIGLVTRVVPMGSLRLEALAVANAIAENGPLAVRAAKAASSCSPSPYARAKTRRRARAPSSRNASPSSRGDSAMPAPPRRHVGQYVDSGDWSDYWTTRISRAESGKIRVRGYPIEELIEHLSYSEAAFLLLRGELPDQRETMLFDLALRSGMDQQLINSAACAARYTASAFPDSPVPALASGILASGSVTGSPQEPAEMLIEALGWGLPDEEAVSRVLDTWLERRGAVPGLGHPMHKEAEPRAVTLRRLAIEGDGWREHGQLLDAIEGELERRKGRRIPINLAGALGAVLADLGFDPLAIGGIGALGYGMALLAHIVEEVREGVPLRIIPDALGAHYAGPADRHLPPDRRRDRK